MNAEYKKVVVTVYHNGQLRSCNLHVVTPSGKPTLYFLVDFYGWSIDSASTVADAVQKYQTGNYHEAQD
jgi:hypothetical protein